MAAKYSVTFAAVAIAIVLAVAMVMDSTDAAISKPETVPLTSWSGPGCSGNSATVESCGCSDLQFYDGQDFEGQTATFYTETGCAGTPYQVTGGIEFCGDYGWRSIYIDC
ncbi:unnamed protein product [Urochloa decumbens]|uniref:Antimicrobial peptide 1 n=1 Tax=Urochloa decumbens TaxID=240449 RepID=A0ABC9CTL0_9POAL